MAERVRPGPASAGPLASYDGCPARHCWVADAVDDFGVKRPGLLLEWRRAGETWEGRVVYAVQLRAGRWAMVEEWLAESQLTPL
jgi:hypothetical protein